MKWHRWIPHSCSLLFDSSVQIPIQRQSFSLLIGLYLPGPGPMAGSLSKQTEQSSVKGRRLELASFCFGACRGQKGIIWHHGSSDAYIVTSGISLRYILQNRKQCFWSALVSMRIRIQLLTLMHNRTQGANADPCGSGSSGFAVTKSEILTWKIYFMYVIRHKHTYVGTTAIQWLNIRFFFLFWSISLLLDPEPHSQYGSGSRRAKSKRIYADPEQRQKEFKFSIKRKRTTTNKISAS
jgi:hypothetical protein